MAIIPTIRVNSKDINKFENIGMIKTRLKLEITVNNCIIFS